MKNNIKFISSHKQPKCWTCEGKGCKTCKGTGRFTEEFYYLIYTDKKGRKLAFGVDSLK